MQVSDEIKRLERSRSNWRTGGMGLIGLMTGAVLCGAVGTESAPSEVASVVIQTGKSSGRWDSTLLAIMENGDIMYLDTTRPKTAWINYKYSPSFGE
jgi:hypothetical protein